MQRYLNKAQRSVLGWAIAIVLMAGVYPHYRLHTVLVYTAGGKPQAERTVDVGHFLIFQPLSVRPYYARAYPMMSPEFRDRVQMRGTFYIDVRELCTVLLTTVLVTVGLLLILASPLPRPPAPEA